MPRNDQVVRQWKLLRQIERAPGGVNIGEYAGGDENRRRQAYRDVQALQEAGFPLYTDTSDGQARWVLTPTFRDQRGLPLPVTEVLALRCARSAIEGLEGAPFLGALQELIDKLDACLTPAMREFAGRLDEVFVGDRFGHPDYSGLKPILDVLGDAEQESRSVEIDYRAAKGEGTTRRVDPYNIWLHRGVPYLVGWCHLRRAVRTFSLWRVQGCRLTEERFEVQPEYRFDDYVRDRFRIFGDEAVQPVRVRFSPEVALYVQERVWHPTQRITEHPDGAVTLEMEVGGIAELVSWVLSFGAKARALAPDALVAAVRDHLQRGLAQYSEDL